MVWLPAANATIISPTMAKPLRLPLGWVRRHTGARTVEPVDHIQTLWSGYGEIVRLRLTGCEHPTLVLKFVDPPTASDHPRGWDTSRSHERKLHSYEVERTFYDTYAPHCGDDARVPGCIETHAASDGWWMLLEDLDAAGFTGRRHRLNADGLDACLAWLASFHATFLGAVPDGLWPVGTYWHLATRPDELEAMTDDDLRAAAPLLDARLNGCTYQTFVHGDAKVANFCFARDGRVAAVDFQYVGGGCGMKDVAYFLSSCMTEVECASEAPRHLDTYFRFLRDALHRRGSDTEVDDLEAEWRALYPIAWADFYRFLAGWSPDHWKMHGYSSRLTRSVLDDLL
jgi:hypothetical protein